jgi:hypothetical protein
MTDDTHEYDLDEFITLEQASTLSGLTKNSLRVYALSGRMKAKKFGRDWLTTPRWVREYLESRDISKQPFKKG